HESSANGQTICSGQVNCTETQSSEPPAMSDTSIHSERQAALIDAHSCACALAQRYAHACDALLEKGRLKDELSARRTELDELTALLDSRIRKHGILPHDINVDREDLARLADRFREWLDHERHSHLKHALAEREAELIDCLTTLRRAGVDDA